MKFVSSILLLIFAAVAVSAQNGPQIIPEKLPPKISEFIKPGGELKRPKATFTGEIIPIPGEIRQLLEQDLYLHQFTIVKMRISFDISASYQELLIISEAKSGNVVSYLWQYGLGNPPESFSKLLRAYPNEIWYLNTTWPQSGVLAKIYGLASIMLYMQREEGKARGLTLKSRVGSMGIEEKDKSYIMSAELIPWFSARGKLILNLNWGRDINNLPNNSYQREYAYGQLKIEMPKE
jgi:hypothetical protein